MPTFLLNDLGANPLLDGFSSSSTPPSFAGLYNPMISLLVAPEDPLLLSDTDDDLPVLFTCTADDENGDVVNWTPGQGYDVDSIVLEIISINNTQDLPDAVLNPTIDAENITPTSTTLKFKYLFVQADIVLLTHIIYYVYAKVTLANGECRRFGRVEINMSR